MSPSEFKHTGRRLNHFCIGSDPEFCFAADENMKQAAYNVGLRTGLAAGCDQNERLVELRPWPSTSVIEHVAGILTTLRWLYRVYGHNVTRYSWRAGAFFAGDGIGGHVHFGRKRPTRPEEVSALDGLAKLFTATGLFPIDEWNRRVRGDELRQRYGDYGDFRVQQHGYEYRTLPSWLQSPTIAFTVLTASKLVVLDPEITHSWFDLEWGREHAQDQLRGLAKYFRSRDDDAYLLYHVLTANGNMPFEVIHGADFKAAWGIPQAATNTLEAEFILPSSIKPHASEVEEVTQHLLSGAAIQFKKIAPSFVHQVPQGYVWAPSTVHPNRRSGFGDLLHNLVTAGKHAIHWGYSNEGRPLFGGRIIDSTTTAERNMLTQYCNPHFSYDDASQITVTKALCQTSTIGGLRGILIHSGIFPIWTVDMVQPDSLTRWEADRVKQLKTKRKPTWRTV
jgi:hypothetical protein